MTGELLRIGLAGLGSMGRNHARVLARLDGVEFVGGADPAGDPHRALGGHRLFPAIDDLLDAGVDAMVLAIPAVEHEKNALKLADAAVHTLIEKPLAADLDGAIAIREAFRDKDLVAAVGHIERFNPALLELKRRLDGRCLGRTFAISTRRTGPFPLRIGDTGVVHDLATHDIDIVHWLLGGFASLRAELGTQIDVTREDMVEAVGRLENDTIVSISVNWLTPMKQRTVTILGERGALVADLLTSDLTFYSNSAIPVEWEEMARLKGVSEGDVTRYAIRKPEPLQSELEAFRDAILGIPGSVVVTLDEGVKAIEMAEAMLAGRLGR
ncbi:MAG: Gfo/Idh/MocA family oxidoreductase [Actinobacteria bacterium]|nr:Gfo/Idh/MocA family oxidoreductase [Actinomycetota bacterium]